MLLNEVGRVVSCCIWADVVPELVGHRGIGKTQKIKDIARNWWDEWMAEGDKGIPCFPLYCATQDVADLIGFPIQVWESDGSPVVRGIPSPKETDRIITSWAEPEWASQLRRHCQKFEESDKRIRDEMIANNASPDDIWAFWNRPKVIVFCDELKRAPREVIQAMYPFLLDKTLHMHRMPRGTRVVTADNFAGAYDLRDPDEAFMSRLCHIEVDPDVKTWHEWAVQNHVHTKIRNFLTSNPLMLLTVPEDQEKASVHYKPIPDPRSWGDMVNRLEKFGRRALPNTTMEIQSNSIKQAIRGLVGDAACEAYWKFSDDSVSFEDILTGVITLKEALNSIENDENDRKKNMLKEKIQIETSGTLKGRKFNKVEAERLRDLIIQFNSRERSSAVLQSIFLMKNQKELDDQWVRVIMDGGPEIKGIVEHLMKKKKLI